MVAYGPLLFRALFLFAVLSGSSHVVAANPAEVDQCLRKASELHHVDYRILRAIGLVESRLNPKAVNRNGNGTGDTGMMQINDWWLPKLATFGIKKADLFDACTSAYVGAWILAHEIQKHGLTWRAVGAYNSPTEANQQIYAQKVFNALQEIP
ncbi:MULTISPECIES: lytic transglycosylase domain-containing protein [Pseudomonas syringae group]|uniref:lytic transglycosylase domain-containing protein n=1 Tax=Pseudomonas syringae group TaxID=136849 RepID=UPI000F005D56|nr:MULTISPECIES: lytic transglycosylase domain-containing protein [Pseudomonas syringae group]MDH4602337.1 lytic transglycosylase domain-containing protein [Pseudomonas syringae pv. papulans]